jgi:hypothetical protein
MGSQIRVHALLAAALLVLLGLRFAGMAVPTAFVYLAVLACPVMMLSMMRGHHESERVDDSAKAPGSRGHPPVR